MGDEKREVANLARVEGSICAFYLHNEITYFCSHYFKHASLLSNTSLRNDHRTMTNEGVESSFSIFAKSSRPTGSCKQYWLTDDEYHSTHVHILINSNEVKPILE